MYCALKIHASTNVTRCSPLRVRVVSDWHPCHPARLQLDVHVSLSQFSSFLTCANVPSDSTANTSDRTGLHQRPIRFERGTHPAKTLRWHRAIASQFQHLRQRNGQRTSSREHWKVHSGSAGFEAFLLRSPLLSGAFRCHRFKLISQLTNFALELNLRRFIESLAFNLCDKQSTVNRFANSH
jgi:hypothetical protein